MAGEEKYLSNPQIGMIVPARFVFLGANSPWVYALATALARNGSATGAIAPYDLLTYLRLTPRWPQGEVPVHLHRERWIMPPGYTGSLAPFFTPILRYKLDRTISRVVPAGNAHPWIITPYPWFVPALGTTPSERLIYFNYDDYQLFRPERAARILRQERHLIERSALILCSSQRQAETLRARCPQKAAVIKHFPHGVVEELFNREPSRVPSALTVGYVGNLIDRVDWRLVGEVADRMPDVEFIFVGGLAGPPSVGLQAGWMAERATALAKVNVHHVGPVSQDDVGGQYWSFGVNWIPYVMDHAFNLACCPTKIMDGLASGRPMVSTDLPECRLYPEWISLARDASEMTRVLREVLTAQTHPTAGEHASAQVAFARQHTWAERAKTLTEWLSFAGGETF